MKNLMFLFLLFLLSSCGSFVKVSGVVVDDQGTPIRGVQVSTDATKRVAKTTAAGAFTFKVKHQSTSGYTDLTNVRAFGPKIKTVVSAFNMDAPTSLVIVAELQE